MGVRFDTVNNVLMEWFYTEKYVYVGSWVCLLLVGRGPQG